MPGSTKQKNFWCKAQKESKYPWSECNVCFYKKWARTRYRSDDLNVDNKTDSKLDSVVHCSQRNECKKVMIRWYLLLVFLTALAASRLWAIFDCAYYSKSKWCQWEVSYNNPVSWKSNIEVVNSLFTSIAWLLSKLRETASFSTDSLPGMCKANLCRRKYELQRKLCLPHFYHCTRVHLGQRKFVE